MTRVLLCLFALLAVTPLTAHELRPSVVELREGEPGEYLLDWKVTLTVGSAALITEKLQPVVPANCVMQGQPTQRLQAAALMGRVGLTCTGKLEGQQFGLSELLGKSDAIARFIPLQGPTHSFRLTANQPSATIPFEPKPLAVVADYFVIGAEHIVFGWDHLLFVIALVLLVRQPWPVIKAATAFTVAHSITLVATVLGYTGLPARPVEALVALSIVFLAVEVMITLRERNRQTLTQRFPWAAAFAFGLVHGFGFAGTLADIGLPQTQLAVALFAFNIGVEAGQLLIVAATLVFLRALARTDDPMQRHSLTCATYLIGTIGSYWLIERLIG